MPQAAWCSEVTAGRLRSAALVYIRGPDGRGLRGKLVRSASDPMKKTGKSKGGDGDGVRKGKAVGDALRDAYDEAIGEAIPDEMLALLKKLD
jgi:Anti-sigma factor NepR